jgi:hypothetical protein
MVYRFEVAEEGNFRCFVALRVEGDSVTVFPLAQLSKSFPFLGPSTPLQVPWIGCTSVQKILNSSFLVIHSRARVVNASLRCRTLFHVIESRVCD